jgi:hypothetical protein
MVYPYDLVIYTNDDFTGAQAVLPLALSSDTAIFTRGQTPVPGGPAWNWNVWSVYVPEDMYFQMSNNSGNFAAGLAGQLNGPSWFRWVGYKGSKVISSNPAVQPTDATWSPGGNTAAIKIGWLSDGQTRLLRCCLGWTMDGSTADTCGGYWRGQTPSLCDAAIVNWCQQPANQTNPYCSCINPQLDPTIASLVKQPWFEPQCHYTQCRLYGYQTANMRTAQCPDVNQINCTQYLTLTDAAKQNIINNAQLAQQCQITSATNAGTTGGVSKVDTPVAPTSTTTPPAAPGTTGGGNAGGTGGTLSGGVNTGGAIGDGASAPGSSLTTGEMVGGMAVLLLIIVLVVAIIMSARKRNTVLPGTVTAYAGPAAPPLAGPNVA